MKLRIYTENQKLLLVDILENCKQNLLENIKSHQDAHSCLQKIDEEKQEVMSLPLSGEISFSKMTINLYKKESRNLVKQSENLWLIENAGGNITQPYNRKDVDYIFEQLELSSKNMSLDKAI